jgi:hypothetical protein
MLTYEDGKKLEKLLKKFSEDDDEWAPEDVAVLRTPISPIESFACCGNNYGSYGGD